MVAKRLRSGVSIEVGVVGYFSAERGVVVVEIEVALPIVEASLYVPTD